MPTVAVPIREDTYINSQSTSTNYSTSSDWFIGEQWGGSGSFRRITLMRLDLRPFTVTVSDATLSFTQYQGGYGGGVTLAARRCLKSYVHGQVTWDQYATGQTWDRDVSDDDFSSTTYGGFTPADSSGVKTMNLTTLVNAFLGQQIAIGLAFTGATSSQNSLLARSTRYSTTGDRPTFVVTTPDLWLRGTSASPVVMG